MYPNEDKVIVMPITKRMEIIISIEVYLISLMNINYKENGGMKRFSYKSNAPISCILFGEHVCSANNKKNGDYYEHRSLSHFTDEH